MREAARAGVTSARNPGVITFAPPRDAILSAPIQVEAKRRRSIAHVRPRGRRDRHNVPLRPNEAHRRPANGEARAGARLRRMAAVLAGVGSEAAIAAVEVSMVEAGAVAAEDTNREVFLKRAARRVRRAVSFLPPIQAGRESLLQ